jgi:GT2 family glycosyltransferase
MRVLVDDVEAMTPTEAFEYVFAFNNHRYVTRKDFTVTANLFCRREMFEKVGGFRVGLSEDVEWSHRAIGAGYRLGYAPAAIVGHPARKTWEDLLKKWRRTNKEAYILYTSRRYGMAAYVARSIVLPFSAVAHTPRVLFSRDLTRLNQKISAIGVLYRLRFWRFINAIALIASGEKSETD